MSRLLRTNGVELLNADGSSPIILACDHAGNLIPPQFSNLGVSPQDRKRHIAFDPGAADVTRLLSEAWNAPAIFQNVSRLVIDVNRGLDHAGSIPPVSDNTAVPGNRDLSAADRGARQRRFFYDYHLNLDALIAKARAADRDPVLICVHSFTRQLELQGEARPWHLGVLHGKDRTLSNRFMTEFQSAYPDLLVGDDEPYSGAGSGAFTHQAHAETVGVPVILLELRQDLIDTLDKAREWAEMIRKATERALKSLPVRRAAGPTANAPFAATVRASGRGTPAMFTMGVEEEYHLVRKDTGEVDPDPPKALFDRLASVKDMMISGEFYRFQVEIGTKPCASLRELRADLARLRGAVIEIADDYGLAPIAAGTHPTANIDDQLITEAPRYQFLRDDQAYPARRLLTCGMHVHAGFEGPDGIEDKALKIDLFGQIRYFLPYFLGLSASSPFWQARDTGMLAYRLCIFHELKNTGLPPVFSSPRDFEDYVEEALRLKVTPDKSMLWWDVRPNSKFPTLEMRVMDVCTRLDDAMAVASLYLCTLSMLTRLRDENMSWRLYDDSFIKSNIWEVQKAGTGAEMVDLARHASVPFTELYDDLTEMLAPDIEAYDCAEHIERGRSIIREGTSAQHQMAIFNKAIADGADEKEAYRQVVMWLVQETAKV